MADLAFAEPETLKVAIVYNPFNAKSIERHDIVFNPANTLADYLGDLPESANYVVGFKGESYEKDQWATVIPAPGEGFSLVVVPEGGGGGGKNILRMVALIAVMVAAIYFAPMLAVSLGMSTMVGGVATATALGTALSGAMIGVAGSILVNAIMPSAMPSFSTSGGATSSPSYGYDGPKNTSQEGVVVPIVYGTYRVGGNIVDLYTKTVGDDQYLFMRTVVNDGAVEAITDLEINDENIANFSNIETRISLGLDDGADNDWFGEAVHQVQKGVKLSPAWTVHTTSQQVDRLRLAYLWPGGIGKTENDGKISPRSVTIEVEYKPKDSDDSLWAPLGGETITNVASLTSGTRGLPGYDSAPAASGLTGWAYVYGRATDGVTFTGGNPHPVTVTNPITGEAETVLAITVPAGYTKIQVQGMANLYANSLDSLSALYHLQARFRINGSGTWYNFGEETGQVARTNGASGVSQFPLVYRTYTQAYSETDTIEVAFFGGMPTSIIASRPDDTGGSVTITANKLTAKRYDYESGVLSTGFYDVRTRVTDIAHEQGDPIIDATYLNDIAEIQIDNVQYVGTANVALKIKMTDQLSAIPKLTALVKGSLVKQFDEEGNLADQAWSPWPCWAALDILMNENRGRGLSSNRIDFQSFKRWEEYCIEKDLKFNLLVDFDSNVWDMVQLCCRVGHAALSRIGTKWSVVIDQPTEQTMMFNDANIIEGTFTTDWVALADRANEIQYTFFDETQGYTQQTLRVTDPLAPNTGAGLRVAQITDPGVTNLNQAKFNVEKQLRENRLLRKSINFEAPLEAIGCTNGDVVAVTHTSANYGHGIGSGRLKPGSTATHLKLDSPVILQPGQTYKAMIIHSAVKRYDVVIHDTNTGYVRINNNVIGSTPKRFRRIIQGGHDIAILDYQAGFDYDTLWLDTTTGLVPGAASLWDTDVCEELTVAASFNTDEKFEVDLTSTALQAPDDIASWMIGPVETYKQLYRLRAIEGANIHQRKLTLLEYNPDIYLPLGSPITLPQPRPRGPVAQANGLYFHYPETFVGTPGTIHVTFNWFPGDTQNYGGADLYLSVNGSAFQYLRSVQNSTTYEIDLAVGDEFRFRVVEFDKKNQRANIDYAPIVGSVVKLTSLDLDPPHNLVISLKDFIVTASVFVLWEPSTSPHIEGYLVEYLDVDQTHYDDFNRGDYVPDDEEPWSVAGLAPSTSMTIVKNGIGYMIVRVRTVYGQSVSPWVTRAFFLDAPVVPGRVTGLTLDNAYGDPTEGVFTGLEAKFSWRDVASLHDSLVAEGADTTGMDWTWRDYEVKILSPEGQLLRRETTVNPFYIYTHEKNYEDNYPIIGEARRTFLIEVRLRGNQGQLSDPAWMEVTNPPPLLVHGVVVPDQNSMRLDILRPADADFVGMLIWASTDPDFEPGPENLVWEGGGVPIWFAPDHATYYIRWAGYDAFGKQDLNVSLNYEVTAEGIPVGALAQSLLDTIDLINGPNSMPGSVNARILSLQNTFTDATSAFADNITAIQAVADGAYAAVATEQTARANADEALSQSIAVQIARIDDNQATISQEAITRANADGALSESINQVSTTVGGHTTTINSFSTSINGVLGRAGVNIDSEGHVVGWVLNNNATSGSMIVRAEYFGVSQPGITTFTPFYVQDSRVYMDTAFIRELSAAKVTFGVMSGDRISVGSLNADRITANTIVAAHLTVGIINASSLILDNVIYTSHLQSQSVSNTVATVGSNQIIPLNTWTTLASVAITTYGGQVLVHFNDSLGWGTNGPRGSYRVLRADNTQIGPDVLFGGGTVPDGLIVSGVYIDSPGSGSTGYVVQGMFTAGNQPTSKSCALVATELKR